MKVRVKVKEVGWGVDFDDNRHPRNPQQPGHRPRRTRDTAVSKGKVFDAAGRAETALRFGDDSRGPRGVSSRRSIRHAHARPMGLSDACLDGLSRQRRADRRTFRRREDLYRDTSGRSGAESVAPVGRDAGKARSYRPAAAKCERRERTGGSSTRERDIRRTRTKGTIAGCCEIRAKLKGEPHNDTRE